MLKILKNLANKQKTLKTEDSTAQKEETSPPEKASNITTELDSLSSSDLDELVSYLKNQDSEKMAEIQNLKKQVCF